LRAHMGRGAGGSGCLPFLPTSPPLLFFMAIYIYMLYIMKIKNGLNSCAFWNFSIAINRPKPNENRQISIHGSSR
jgi:hypothetical protein